MRVHKHLKITGLVQGVFYRASAYNEAVKLNLKGWIKNAYDQSVLASVEGDEENVNAFIAWCRKGPPGARVENITVEEKSIEHFKLFEIRK